MAIEDEIINITDIDIGTEILNSDYLLIETSNGTKRLAFKDFVVGPDNISSIRQDQIESGNNTGIATEAHYSTVSGFDILTNQTSYGLNTEYNQISGTIELGKFNYNAIANLASVSADISINESRIAALEDNFSALDTFIRDTDLSSVTITNSACNFEVTGATKTTNRKSSALGFTKATLDPTSTNANASLQLSPFKLTFPSTGQGFEASYFLLDGTFSMFRLFRSARGHGGSRSPDITIYIDSADGSSRPVFKTKNLYSNKNDGTSSEFNFQKIVRIKPGESIRLSTNEYSIRSGTLLGFKL
jgi:hypothetical protein